MTNPPDRSPSSATAGPPPPRRSPWGSLLRQAPLPPVPADFAARLQAQVAAQAEAARGEALLLQGLLVLLVAAGAAFALPGLGSGFSALLAQLGEAVGGVLAIGGAMAAAWAVDLALRRQRGLLDL